MSTEHIQSIYALVLMAGSSVIMKMYGSLSEMTSYCTIRTEVIGRAQKCQGITVASRIVSLGLVTMSVGSQALPKAKLLY